MTEIICPSLSHNLAAVPCIGRDCAWYIPGAEACAIPIIALALTVSDDELHPPAAPPTPPAHPAGPQQPAGPQSVRGEPVEPRCRLCGCTQADACMTAEGPCHWVEPDPCPEPAERVCSACVPPLPDDPDPAGADPRGADPRRAPAGAPPQRGLYLPVNELLIPGPSPSPSLSPSLSPSEAPYGP